MVSRNVGIMQDNASWGALAADDGTRGADSERATALSVNEQAGGRLDLRCRDRLGYSDG